MTIRKGGTAIAMGIAASAAAVWASGPTVANEGPGDTSDDVTRLQRPSPPPLPTSPKPKPPPIPKPAPKPKPRPRPKPKG